MENTEGIDLLIFFIGGSLVLLLLALSIVMLTMLHGRKLFKKQMIVNEMKLRHQEELMDHFINATEEERRRLASDLHDDVGTRLATFRQRLKSTEEPESGGLRNEIDDIIQNVRNISHDLMPASIDLFGLSVPVSQLCTSFNQEGKIHFVSEMDDTLRLDKKTTLSLYRILQELMNNTHRHSGATMAGIRIAERENFYLLTYQDNGKGIQPGNQDGIGMRNIENRVRMINASLQWNSDASAGMSAKIEIPFPTNEN